MIAELSDAREQVRGQFKYHSHNVDDEKEARVTPHRSFDDKIAKDCRLDGH